MFQIVQPNVRSHDLLWPANTNEIHVPGFKSHLNMNLVYQDVGKQRKKNYGKITEIYASLPFLTLPIE
jgi:hypothetical protein